MEQTQPSVMKTALNYGVLLALLTIILQVISYVLDAHIDRPWWLTLLQLIISIGVLTVGIRAFKIENSGYLTIGQALKTGVAISLVAGIIAIIFNYIFMTFIDPDFVAKTLEFSREQMETNPNLTAEQIDMSMEMSAKFMTPFIMSAISLLMTLFFGFIISLVVGAFLKRSAPQQF